MKTIALATDNSHSLPLRLKQAAVGLSIAVTTVGALVLIGWALDIILLKQVMAGLPTMKPNTALCFLLSGAALLLLNKEDVKDWRRHLAVGCAAVVVLIALMTLAEYLFKLNLGFDELMFREGLNPIATSHPGRMGIHTAFNFLFAGLALLLLDAKSPPKQWIGQTTALAVMLVGLLVLIGYLYGAAFFQHIFSHTSMALHTALTFIALGLGLLAARPQQGLMTLATSAGAGGVMLRRLLPTSIIILVGIGWLCLVGERAGLYDTPLGTALHISFGIVVFTL
nr:hypothetical protein [Acidobacteriota bacterium]